MTPKWAVPDRPFLLVEYSRKVVPGRYHCIEGFSPLYRPSSRGESPIPANNALPQALASGLPWRMWFMVNGAPIWDRGQVVPRRYNGIEMVFPFILTYEPWRQGYT